MTVENDDEKTSNEMANGEVKKSRDLQPSGNSTLSNDSGIQETPDPPDLSCKTFGSINTDGKCFSCDDASASNTALTCVFCRQKFHAVCKSATGDRSGSDTICARTFYTSFMTATSDTGVYSKRPGNFLFSCNPCLTHLEQKGAVTQESKVDVIDKRVDSLTKEFIAMKEVLQTVAKAVTKTHSANPPLLQTQPSYASTLSTPAPRSVLVVESQSDESSSLQVEKIITDNSIHVDKSYKNRKGATVYVCPTDSDRKCLKDKLSELNLPEVKIFQPPEKLPTLSVANLPQEISKEGLHDMILHSQPEIRQLVTDGESLSVLNVRKQRNNDNFQATVRVSNKVRSLIAKQRDRIYLGSRSHYVFDHFHVKRCNKCQSFNHYAQDCSADHHTCGHCAGRHTSDDCPVKGLPASKCCNNCKGSPFDSEKISHSAFDRNCPSYRSAQTKQKGQISYYQSKN